MKLTSILVGTTAMAMVASAAPSPHLVSPRQDMLSTAMEDGQLDPRRQTRDARAAKGHRLRRVGASYEAYNPGQDWRTYFDGRGFRVEPWNNDWTWGLELESYGFGDKRHEVSLPVDSCSDGNHLVYDWGPDLEEWYINDSRGLEHGYTLYRRPPSETDTPLTLTLEQRGGSRSAITDGGRGLRFSTDQGAVLTYTGLTVFDRTGATFDAFFRLHDGRIDIVVHEEGARYPPYSIPLWIILAKCPEPGGPTWAHPPFSVKASNTGSDDEFGDDIAISGDTVVVGARIEQSNATGVDGDQLNNEADAAGAAYVFSLHGATVWIQDAYLKASNTDAEDQFGSAVDISGDTIIVGAFFEDSTADGIDGNELNNSASGAGAAYVFRKSDGVWAQEAYVKASNSNPLDFFGADVAIDGDTAVVGAPWEDSGSNSINGIQVANNVEKAGAAYVFVRSGTTWTQQAYLKAFNSDEEDWFGLSVAIDGDTIVVGARGESSATTTVDGDELDNSAPSAGAAYVFVRNGSTWTQQAYLKASNAEAGDEFGQPVAISGDLIAVGAWLEDGSAAGINGNAADNSTIDSGAAYLFRRNGDQWVQEAYVKASNPDSEDWFGQSIAVDDERVVVGAPYEDSSATGIDGNESSNAASRSGAAYVFLNNLGWSQVGYVKASNTGVGDKFGGSVGLGGNRLIIAADCEDSASTGIMFGDQTDNSAPESGAVYGFDLGGIASAATIYCSPANVNSTGFSAAIDLEGGPVALFNDLTLSARNLPPNQFGYFLAAPTQAVVVNPGGSQGTLCLGQPVGRFAGQVQNSGIDGVISVAVDLTAIPQLGAVMSGDRLNFQGWFRDVNPVPTSNFTDAVSVLFE